MKKEPVKGKKREEKYNGNYSIFNWHTSLCIHYNCPFTRFNIVNSVWSISCLVYCCYRHHCSFSSIFQLYWKSSIIGIRKWHTCTYCGHRSYHPPNHIYTSHGSFNDRFLSLLKITKSTDSVHFGLPIGLTGIQHDYERSYLPLFLWAFSAFLFSFVNSFLCAALFINWLMSN